MGTVRHRAGLRLLALAGLAVGAILLAGCSTGAYPVDFFTEMHYAPFVRLQEPPRLSPPSSAVAFAGVGTETELIAAPAYDLLSREDLAAIRENALLDTAEVRELGRALFTRNCAVCHGAQGDGQGFPLVTASFTAAGAKPPANLTSTETRARSEGEIFAIITHGQGDVPVPGTSTNPQAWAELTNMPAFRVLLATNERWALVRHIRALQGQ